MIDAEAAEISAFSVPEEPLAPIIEWAQRYLRFMRSPVYYRRRDLVAASPEGRIASFMVWWPDPSGIAQIEPFGTHPDFQRQGTGRALMYYALKQMRAAGMTLARVITDEPRSDATAFYSGVGFREVERVRWWNRHTSRD